MSAKILDGKALAARIKADLANEVSELRARGIEPGLAVVLVGEDPASQIYVRNKTASCAQAGIRTFDHRLPATTSQAELMALVAKLNADPAVDGILIQLPLPRGLDARELLPMVDPRKDVDGIHPDNLGHLVMGEPRFVACTPFGVMKLIEESGLSLAGTNAVVVGRSSMVGKPMAALLTNADATVTVCHSKTRDLAAVVAGADLVVAAVGRPEMIRGAWIKPGAVVIDVGINRRDDGKLLGDVEFAPAAARASAITPVPGGVGPMTIAMLLVNTVTAAKRRATR
jgi:methylenetetrahydrofolate dehydrogenase (NADP+)/methenyltetrahydrofolate cyclohydrolase